MSSTLNLAYARTWNIELKIRRTGSSLTLKFKKMEDKF